MSTKQQIALETRHRLLAAASRVVLNLGVGHLTLDAVASEAGVSKGGLLYHFPTKDALISGLLEDLLRSFDESIATALASGIDGSDGVAGRFLSAYVRASTAEDPRELELSAGLLAAISTNLDLLIPWQQQYQIWQQRITQDGVDPVIATIVRLAVDGLWADDLFNIAPPDPVLRQQVVERLLKLSKGDLL